MWQVFDITGEDQIGKAVYYDLNSVLKDFFPAGVKKEEQAQLP